ncbi:hypothetical protein ACFV9C_44530 [Kribbella sp. NPDC059898]|uniref:hypothetical protein n=1 Tax=Kribbella sp. NPDC059898 TaxID=3346995 RepID=UPI003655661C
MEASRMVEALEQVWAGIQRRHPDVPAVVVTLGAGSVGVPAGYLKLGHFAERRWVATDDPAGMSELFVGGEGLARGAASVLATLLHEAAHGIAHVRRIDDTSRQGRYHNAKYKALGEEVGLTITQTPPIGWSGTALAPGTTDEYVDELETLDRALVTYRHSEHEVPADPAGGDGDEDETGAAGVPAAGGGRPPKNGYSLTCGCKRRIRASAAVAEAGPILCGLCQTEFTR